ncbi:hypothetical protein LOD99_87 [Oopsacas minuta]|uniref:Uncharacterized protein n=1 Tax=Oopsacas minuta TaxID=111878 RepID=A0AAV7K9M5_9METZ|nr:hypothetical protein LOD99_87 [Oopsacas minuta]
MDSIYGRDVTAQTQLRFSLNKANNFQRPDSLQGQIPQNRPFPRYQIGDIVNSNPPSNIYQTNFHHPNHLQNRVFVSPVTLTHVSSGHAINIDTRDIEPPSPNDRQDIFSNSDPRGYMGSSSREEHFIPPNDYDQIEQVSIPESGDSGLSRTPDNSSEGPPIQLIDPSFRPRNSTAPQPTVEYIYQQKHLSAQRQRSSNLPSSSRIEFSIKLSLRPTQYTFGLILGEGAIVEKVDGAPAINEDIQVGDKVSSINGRACDQLSHNQLKELLTEAARYRSVTLNISRVTRPVAPELHRTYTDLPLGSIRISQPPYMNHSSYAPPIRYLSCRHLAPHTDDSSQGRHSWPHCPIIPAATGPQPIRYQPRDGLAAHQLYSGISDVSQLQEDSMLSTIHEVPRKQHVNSMQMVLETMRQLRDKYGPELEQRELQNEQSKRIPKRSEDPFSKITNSAHLLGDCIKDLRNKFGSDPDRTELIYLLSSLNLTHTLVSHDRIATIDFFTLSPSPLYPHSGLTPLHSPGKLPPNISRSVSSSGLLEGTNSREFRIDSAARSGSVASALQLIDLHTRENSRSSSVYQRPISRTVYGGKGINARIVLVRKSHKQMGCTVNKVGDSIIVTGTLKHSDAEKCGRLHPGDEILEVNGKTVRGRSSEHVMNFILSQTGPMIVFLIVPCLGADKKEIFIRPFYDFSAQQVPDCSFIDVLLPFNKGEILRLLSCHDDEWWEAKQLVDAPEAVPGLIPAKKKEDPNDLLPGEVPEPGGKSKKRSDGQSRRK